MIIDRKFAEKSLIENGYEVVTLSVINEGSNHYVFDAVLKNGENVICKFQKTRETEISFQEDNRDTMYNGPISLERETNLLKMALYDAKVPAPQIYGVYTFEHQQFIVMEKCKGKPFIDYLRDVDFDEKCFINSIQQLGRDFAKIHRLKYNSFGNLCSNDKIEPENISNFSDYYKDVVKMHLDRATQKGVFNKSEYEMIEVFLQQKFDEFKDVLSIDVNPPTYVITDMHANNYFVDEYGKPSGYFDVESTQAAPASFEYYGFEFFIFNMFDKEAQNVARLAFFEGYEEENGFYPISVNNPQTLVDYFSALRLLELSQSYWGYVDGLRDEWGEKMKNIFMKYMETDELDYLAIGDIFRERDNIPNHLKK